MAKKQIEELILNYESACNELVEKFSKKQGLEFDGWAGDEVGGIACFSCQYFFSISDIILDLKTKQPKHKILYWQNEDVDYNMRKKEPKHINYKSYIMGARHDLF